MNMNSFIVLYDYISLSILHIMIMAFFNVLEYNVQQINVKHSCHWLYFSIVVYIAQWDMYR